MRWGTVVAGLLAALAVGIPLVGYLLGALYKRKEIAASTGPADPFSAGQTRAVQDGQDVWVVLGRVDQFPVGETRVVRYVNPIRQPWDGMVAHTDCFVRNLGKDGIPVEFPGPGRVGMRPVNPRDENDQYRFLVLAVNCAHLGCPVSWFPQSGLFMCPCHGGVYYEDGQHASGPPPRGMFPYVTRVVGGELQVQPAHLPTLQDTLTDRT
jgi:nitrite reductase/ring-hydroxylating ferredoxin subunit